MRLTRVHLSAPLVEGARLALPERAGAHLVRALRLRAGAPLAVFDGAGREHAAVLAGVNGERVEVAIGAPRTPPPESPLVITLVQGVSRGERMDYALQKATELGVARIVPVLAERSVVRLDAAQAERRLEHWRGVAAAACEQCGRATVPEIAPPRRFLEYLAAVRGAAAPDAVRLVLAPGGPHALRDLPAPLAAAELLIGPEGGLSDEEESLALGCGWLGLRLGPRVLRTETAAAAAIAVLQALRGDLG